MAREKVTIRERRSGKSEEEPTEQPEVKAPETKKVHEGDSLLFSSDSKPSSQSLETKKVAEVAVKEQMVKNEEPSSHIVKQANEELMKKYVHKTDDGYLQIKLPPRFMIERIVYIALILILIYMLIFNPFGQKSFTLNITMPSLPTMGDKNTTGVTQTPITTAPVIPATENPPVNNSITQPEVIKPTTPVNTTPTVTTGSCSATGKPSIDIKDVQMDSTVKNKVNAVIIKITNNGNTALTSFKLDLNWYTQLNKEDTMYFKRLRSSPATETLGFYPFTTENIKACGGIATITLDDEIKSRYITAGEKNTVRVRLLDAGGERELAATTIEVTPEE